MDYSKPVELYASRLVAWLASTGAHRATLYLSPTLTVKATRRKYKCFKGKRQGYSPRSFEVLVTCSKPNYSERKFIKLAKKSGVKFPINKPLLKYR